MNEEGQWVRLCCVAETFLKGYYKNEKQRQLLSEWLVSTGDIA